MFVRRGRNEADGGHVDFQVVQHFCLKEMCFAQFRCFHVVVDKVGTKISLLHGVRPTLNIAVAPTRLWRDLSRDVVSRFLCTHSEDDSVLVLRDRDQPRDVLRAGLRVQGEIHGQFHLPDEMCLHRNQVT